MRIPLQVTVRDIPHSEAIETRIHEKAEKLERFYDRIMSCRVVVDSTQRHKQQGKLYNVRIDMTVPGGELAANRVENEDIYVAIRDAFEAAQRQLQDYARRQRGEVKNHKATLHARVGRVFTEEGYGFLQTPDGREVYFHENAVMSPGFDSLRTGAEVLYEEDEGDEGPRALMVTAGKRHTTG